MPLQWETLRPGSCYRAPAPLFGNIRVERYREDDPWEVNWSVPGYCDHLIKHPFASAMEAKRAADKYVQNALEEFSN